MATLLTKVDEASKNGKHWDDTAKHLQHIREFIWVQLSDEQKRKSFKVFLTCVKNLTQLTSMGDSPVCKYQKICAGQFQAESSGLLRDELVRRPLRSRLSATAKEAARATAASILTSCATAKAGTPTGYGETHGYWLHKTGSEHALRMANVAGNEQVADCLASRRSVKGKA